jgi:membrane-bound lytic murein transglycosylase B
LRSGRTGSASAWPSMAQSPPSIAIMMDGLEPDSRIIDRDRSQPEFVRPVWVYLNGAASDARTQNGLRRQARHREALDTVEARFGVDADILTAIWGLESAYGVIMGISTSSARWPRWPGRGGVAVRRNQLLAVADMIERGYADRDQLVGSWAGAMGQTQFIPTTYLERAVDMHGDGRRDIWTTEADALGSAANLLARQAGRPMRRW